MVLEVVRVCYPCHYVACHLCTRTTPFFQLISLSSTVCKSNPFSIFNFIIYTNIGEHNDEESRWMPLSALSHCYSLFYRHYPTSLLSWWMLCVFYVVLLIHPQPTPSFSAPTTGLKLHQSSTFLPGGKVPNRFHFLIFPYSITLSNPLYNF